MGVVKVDTSQFEKLRKSLNQVDVNDFCTVVSKELAARLLAKVIKRTPVRKPENCPPGVKGGTLRRGWTAEQNQSAVTYAQSLPVHHFGNDYVIEIINPVHYASYVEFGHRTANHKGWVNGIFMLTISEQEVQNSSHQIIEKKLKNWLKGVLED